MKKYFVAIGMVLACESAMAGPGVMVGISYNFGNDRLGLPQPTTSSGLGLRKDEGRTTSTGISSSSDSSTSTNNTATSTNHAASTTILRL